MTTNGDDGFKEMWRRVTRDPLLLALWQEHDDGLDRAWWVERGRIVTTDQTLDEGAITAPPTDTFIGRERERATARNLVLQTQLLTITGRAGVGKTRLARETIATITREFPDGVAWVDLSEVTQPELVGVEVSSQLEVQQGCAGSIMASDDVGSSFVERLAGKLGRLGMLLVLDGCEHVREGCEQLLDALLAVHPSLHVLCTSREPIGVDGECTLPLLPLSLPPPPGLAVQDALQADSVRLFRERASAVRETSLSDAELLVAMRICRRLEGVPRAIEMAAGQAADTPISEIHDRLHDQSIAECAYQRLSTEEQRLLRRLSVFRGGLAVQAAVDVCADEQLSAAAVRRTLDALVSASLLLYDPFENPARCKLPEPLREYASMQLEASGEAEDMKARHRHRFLDLAQAVGAELQGPDQVEALDLLESELDNLRVALEFRDAAEAERSLHGACRLQRFWVARGLLSEGRLHVERALAARDAVDRGQVEGFAVAAKLANNAGDYHQAKRLAQAALEGARTLGLPEAEATALRELGIEAHRRGHLEAASSLLRSALAINQAEGQQVSEVTCLNRLSGILEWRGDLAGARAAEERAVRVARDSGDLWGLAWSLYWLGLRGCDAVRGETKELLEEALVLSRRLGCQQLTVFILVGLGRAAYLRRELTVAESHFSEALGVSRSLEEQTSYYLAVAGIAGVEMAREHIEPARRWLEGQNPDGLLVGRLARAVLLAAQARLAQKTGDTALAELLHRRALGLWHELRNLRRVTEHLEGLGVLAARHRDSKAAATLLAASERLRKLSDSPPPWDSAAALLRARQELSSSTQRGVRDAWERGARCSVDEAVAFVLPV